MKRHTSFLRKPLLMAGAAVLGYAGVKALLDLGPGADADFFHWTGPTAKGVDVGSAKIDLPIMYYRDDCFMGVFTAAYEPVRGLLPSRELYPVMASVGRDSPSTTMPVTATPLPKSRARGASASSAPGGRKR